MDGPLLLDLETECYSSTLLLVYNSSDCIVFPIKFWAWTQYINIYLQIIYHCIYLFLIYEGNFTYFFQNCIKTKWKKFFKPIYCENFLQKKNSKFPLHSTFILCWYGHGVDFTPEKDVLFYKALLFWGFC